MVGLGTFRDGWAQAGFGPDYLPLSRTEEFRINYLRAAEFEIGDPLELARDLAREISQHGRPAVIVSGGIDSQAMAYAFRTAGVDADYIQVRYGDGLNDHDLKGDFYRNHDIPLTTIDLDVRAFHESDELLSMAKRYSIASPHIVTHAKICQLIEGVVVSGGCPVNTGVGGMSFTTFGLSRYAAIEQRPMVPFFFNYCPRLFRSISGEDSSPLPEYELKVHLYQRAGFPVEPQPRKLHGFERVKEHYDATEVPTATRLRYRDKLSARPYDLLFRYPLEDAVPHREGGRHLDWRIMIDENATPV